MTWADGTLPQNGFWDSGFPTVNENCAVLIQTHNTWLLQNVPCSRTERYICEKSGTSLSNGTHNYLILKGMVNLSAQLFSFWQKNVK